MASKTLIRILLVVVLIVTAHNIKPFSFGNVTLHALSAARSFSFVMPDTAVERIEHANYLAQTFGKRWLDSDDASLWTSEDVLRSGLVAFAAPVVSFDDAEIRDIKSSEPVKRTAPKRPVRRIKRDDHRDDDSSGTRSNDIANLPEAPDFDKVAMLQPIDLPVYQPRVIKARFVPSSGILTIPGFKLDLDDCGKAEVKMAKLTAFVQRAAKVKVELMVMPKGASIVSQCRDAEAKEAETVEVIETTIGPEEESFFSPEPVAPLSMPRYEEECIRIQ